MLQLTTRINTKNIIFPFCETVTIESSYDNLTDRAFFRVPKKIKFTDENGEPVENLTKGENALFKRGDAVSIELGYDHNTTTRFEGVLSGIKTKFPLEFQCEDALYNLKQTSLTLSLKNPQLSELLEQVIPDGITYEITASQNLGDFRITDASPARVLDELRKKHGIYSFFRNDTLYIGLAVVPALQNTIRFTMFKDIIDADRLQYINDFDRKIKIVAKSIKDDNTQLQATAGDEQGETRTLYFYNIQSIEDLQKIADSKINDLKYSGYEGSFTTFLTPVVNHGDIVEIINPQIPEQNGGYIANKIQISSGIGGGRQTITIKQKVYDL